MTLSWVLHLRGNREPQNGRQDVDVKDGLVGVVLWSLSAARLPAVMTKQYSGQGGILAFHRVCRPTRHEFGSSNGLAVSPDKFRQILQTLIDRGYSFLSMSELADRLMNPETMIGQKFVALTFDDGFVDNYTDAFPICRDLGVPMTSYLVSGFVLREFPLWSAGLEATIALNDALEFPWEGKEFRLETRTIKQKRAIYRTVASRLATAKPAAILEICTALGSRYGLDFIKLGDTYTLTPAMIAEMQASGLVEFGAHGVHHASLAHLDSAEARWEIVEGKRQCEALVGAEVRHFAYPYGGSESMGEREVSICREIGFRTAVTTESNTIFGSDRDRLLALPRLTYNGKYQDTPLLDLLLSGTLPWLRRQKVVEAFRRTL